ncbi:hypothetical protein [Arthrobacter sp. NtRootA1]|uniref:hypothetical protein n=1 Tax=Micrococcaceae TaxID=1268 RepID=UPI001CC82933|nr:hypothetical protein [Arthrobacter sp. NtRootA1]
MATLLVAEPAAGLTARAASCESSLTINTAFSRGEKSERRRRELDLCSLPAAQSERFRNLEPSGYVVSCVPLAGLVSRSTMVVIQGSDPVRALVDGSGK